MSKKPYQDDINDLVEKGGVGSGIRGHKTESSRSAIKNRKTGQWETPDSFYEGVRTQLMNYSGMSDAERHAGSFMSIKQVAHAISKITDHSSATSFDFAREMVKTGRIKQFGKIFMVMKPGSVEKGGVGSGVRGHKTALKYDPQNSRYESGNKVEPKKSPIKDAPEMAGFKVVGEPRQFTNKEGTTYVEVEYEATSGGMNSKYGSDKYRDEWQNKVETHYGKTFEIPGKGHANRVAATSVGWDTQKKVHILSFTLRMN